MSTNTPLSDYASYEFFVVSSPATYVAHVEINRTQKLNSFSHPVWLEFGRVFRQLSADPEVRAIVLSGAGDRAFTAGLDVQAASQDGVLSADISDPARKAKLIRAHIDEFQDAISAMEKCEKRELSTKLRVQRNLEKLMLFLSGLQLSFVYSMRYLSALPSISLAAPISASAHPTPASPSRR